MIAEIAFVQRDLERALASVGISVSYRHEDLNPDFPTFTVHVGDKSATVYYRRVS